MSHGTPNCPVFVLCPAFVPCSFIIHFKGSVTNLGQIKAQTTRSRIWRRLASKMHKIVWRPGRRGQRGFRTPGFQVVVKVAQQFVLSLTPECTKTLLRAFPFSKILPGLYPGPPREKGRDGTGRGRRGRGGRGEGRKLSRFGPTELWSPYFCLVTDFVMMTIASSPRM
jgi:hypothetical protein